MRVWRKALDEIEERLVVVRTAQQPVETTMNARMLIALLLLACGEQYDDDGDDNSNNSGGYGENVNWACACEIEGDGLYATGDYTTCASPNYSIGEVNTNTSNTCTIDAQQEFGRGSCSCSCRRSGSC